jgi:hypothetical protein
VPVTPFLFLLAGGVFLRLPVIAAAVTSVIATYWSWSLAMYREVGDGHPLGVINAVAQITLEGLRLPWPDHPGAARLRSAGNICRTIAVALGRRSAGYMESVLSDKSNFPPPRPANMKNLTVILHSKAVIVALFCVLLSVVSFVIPIEANDFNDVYYPAGSSVLKTGTFDYSYWDSVDKSAGEVGDDIEGFVNIPLIAYLFVPFAVFDIQTAGVFFEVTTYIMAFVIALKLLARSHLDRWILFFLFLCSRHFYTSIQFGQLTILCFLLLVLTFVTHQKRWLIATGLLLTSAFLIKIPLSLLYRSI